MDEVREAVKDQLEEVGKQPLDESERIGAKRAFDKYDSDGNGTIDNAELKMMLKTEFRIGESQVDSIMAKFDSNKDGKMDFEEFCRLCQFNRNALMIGQAMDLLDLAVYAKWGCCCCLCTGCLSWIPYCCKAQCIKSRTLNGEYQKQALKSNKPAPAAPPAAADGSAAAPAAAPAAAAPESATAERV